MLILNIATFYLSWWGILFCGSNQYRWGLLLIPIVHLLIHFKFSVKSKDLEIKTIMLVTIIGVAADLIFHHLNIFKLQLDFYLWLPVVWLVFASTVNFSLKSVLRLNLIVLFLLGSIFGPLSYWGASKFGLIIYDFKFGTLFLHPIFWGGFLLLLKRQGTRNEIF